VIAARGSCRTHRRVGSGRHRRGGRRLPPRHDRHHPGNHRPTLSGRSSLSASQTRDRAAPCAREPRRRGGWRGGDMWGHRGRGGKKKPSVARRGGRRGGARKQQGRHAAAAVAAANATAAGATAAGATCCRVRARVVRTVVHCSPRRRRQARRQHRQRRWPPPQPAARGCCGKGRDHEDRSAFNPNTTPCLKTQKRRLRQGPQSPILANYCGIANSWPFVAASNCPHDPVNAASALAYLFNHDSASADRTGDEDVATSSNSTERCKQPRRMLPSSRKRRGTSSNGVGSQMDRQKHFLSSPATCTRKKDCLFDVWVWVGLCITPLFG